jgi:hypothetical protein
MTLAVGTSTSTKQTVPLSVPIVILGTDAVLAALPATAVQLAHACIEAGFVSVIPASWGDELIAAATLRRLPEFGDAPVIHCSCPIVAHRLLSASGDLRPVLLPLVPPPVALARYVRALSQPNRARVTYVGNCPGAIDESIDIRMTPDALLSMLAERRIDIDEQPRVFESFIPADRRRFRSQPGGLPTADMLWSDDGARSLVEIEGDDLAAEVAQHVLGGRNVLIDAAVKLGCVCSGAIAGQPTKDARAFLALLEPPRASAAVVDEKTPIDLDLPIPAAPRTPIDVMAAPAAALNSPSAARTIDLPLGSMLSPPRGVAAIPDPRQAPRTSPPARPVGGSSPVVRPADGKEGKTLPRAYVARRRLSPRSTPIVPAEPLAEQALQARQELDQEESVEQVYSVELIELEAPAAASDRVESPNGKPNEPVEIPETRDDVAAVAVNADVESPTPQSDELLEPVAFEFNAPVAFQTMAGVEPATADTPLGVGHRIERPEPRETDDHLDVAIPLSHWTEPPVASSKNSESADVQAFARADEAVQPTPAAVPVPASQTPLNTRKVVLVLLAVVALTAAVSATLVILAERQFAPRPTSSASTDR